VQRVALVTDDDRVAGVGAAVVADDDVVPGREQIDDLALATAVWRPAPLSVGLDRCRVMLRRGLQGFGIRGQL
jgi:hypothetical protein